MNDVRGQFERIVGKGQANMEETLDSLIEFCANRGAACDNDGDIQGVERWEQWAIQFEKLSAGD